MGHVHCTGGPDGNHIREVKKGMNMKIEVIHLKYKDLIR